MATGSYMTPIYSRSQSEVLGDLHNLQEIIENDPVDMNAVETAFEQLRIKSAKLKELEDAVLELMNESNCTQTFPILVAGPNERPNATSPVIKTFNGGRSSCVVENSLKNWTLWSLARVIPLIPGKDGHVRIARVTTEAGKLVRPVQRLYNLELQEPEINLPKYLTDSVIRTRRGRQVIYPKRLTYA
ncbi:hypothetical protein TNCV_4877951 [Trichonephila clavipes]|nr:hypothetical protein TNCV_4877951 [Trichonephila clavipes]